MVSCQAANIIGSFLLSYASTGVKMPWIECCLSEFHLPIPAFASEPFSKACRQTHSYFRDRQRHAIIRLSIHRPLPFMLILIFASVSTSNHPRTGYHHMTIGVEDLWRTMLRQGLFQRLNAELCIHAVGQPPSQNLAAVPIHYCHEIQKATPHWDIADIRDPKHRGSTSVIFQLTEPDHYSYIGFQTIF